MAAGRGCRVFSRPVDSFGGARTARAGCAHVTSDAVAAGVGCRGVHHRSGTRRGRGLGPSARLRSGAPSPRRLRAPRIRRPRRPLHGAPRRDGPQHWFGSLTAARLWGMPVPPHYSPLEPLHVLTVAGTRAAAAPPRGRPCDAARRRPGHPRRVARRSGHRGVVPARDPRRDRDGAHGLGRGAGHRRRPPSDDASTAHRAAAAAARDARRAHARGGGLGGSRRPRPACRVDHAAPRGAVAPREPAAPADRGGGSS